MMDILIENTVKEVEAFNDEIRSDLSTKGIDNSRRAANSLREEVVESGNSIKVQSWGVDYLYFLDQGRGPGKMPPPDALSDWAATKPVDIPVFAIGLKIAREGTEIYKNKSRGIQLRQKRERLLSKLKQEAPKWAKQDLLIKLKSFNKA